MADERKRRRKWVLDSDEEEELDRISEEQERAEQPVKHRKLEASTRPESRQPTVHGRVETKSCSANASQGLIGGENIKASGNIGFSNISSRRNTAQTAHEPFDESALEQTPVRPRDGECLEALGDYRSWMVMGIFMLTVACRIAEVQHGPKTTEGNEVQHGPKTTIGAKVSYGLEADPYRQMETSPIGNVVTAQDLAKDDVQAASANLKTNNTPSHASTSRNLKSNVGVDVTGPTKPFNKDKCYHCSVTGTLCEGTPCRRCKKYSLLCERPDKPWKRNRFTAEQIAAMRPYLRVALPPRRPNERNRSDWVTRDQEKLLIGIAKQLDMSPQAVRNKMTELRDHEDVKNTSDLQWWPPREEWDVLDDRILEIAERLRSGTLPISAPSRCSPPFAVLIVIWRISQDPPPDAIRAYGDIEYVGGYKGMEENASMGEKAFLEDNGWTRPNETHRIMLGPNVSSLTRLWPSKNRASGLPTCCWDLIELIEKLAETGQTVRILSTGIDGFSTMVSSVAGLIHDYPDMTISLTTMVGFAWVDNVELELLSVFDSCKDSMFLYNTTTMKDIARRFGLGKLVAEYWDMISSAKLGQGPQRNKPACRNIQAYLVHEYKTLSNACTLCLRRFGTMSALKLHFENSHAKPFICRLCVGSIKKRFRHDPRRFASLQDLHDHQKECSLGVLGVQEE
ncbi:hypothetical protein K491DRAFT_784769 [Lophiostoma macrostomum CBS 122681]|uniref:C2H2-type domain-containing protein n=1 Tax=Lophiostoma macrostomum CBS 122681 TaxID=1314788 RepID=A0A6A6SMH2_9PLEO|nr:hypothetical protein K491DRAFT_784769 [Lophiostoma macrostomum CBS 122681]